MTESSPNPLSLRRQDPVGFSPLPGWQDLPPEEQRRLAAAAITQAENAARAKREAEGQTVMPRHRLLATSPSDRPRRPKRGKRPLCHTTIPERFQAFREEWWLFRQDYGAASEKYRGGAYATRFPDGSIRPPLLDVS